MVKLNPRTGRDGLRVGIVVSRFNSDVTSSMLTAAHGALEEAGIPSARISTVTVPGALESPLALQAMAQTRKFEALVALGAVIRGETFHFEIVAQQSAAGIMSVQLESGIPIGNGILTTDTEKQALARAREKARDAVHAAIEMANLLEDLRESAK